MSCHTVSCRWAIAYNLEMAYTMGLYDTYLRCNSKENMVNANNCPSWWSPTNNNEYANEHWQCTRICKMSWEEKLRSLRVCHIPCVQCTCILVYSRYTVLSIHSKLHTQTCDTPFRLHRWPHRQHPRTCTTQTHTHIAHKRKHAHEFVPRYDTLRTLPQMVRSLVFGIHPVQIACQSEWWAIGKIFEAPMFSSVQRFGVTQSLPTLWLQVIFHPIHSYLLLLLPLPAALYQARTHTQTS